MSKAKEVVSKLTDLLGDSLPDELRVELENLEFVSSDDANARAKSERQRAERKALKAVEEKQTQIDELMEKMEELSESNNGSKADKALKDFERMKDKYEKATSQINELQGNLESTKRNALISSAASGINFAEGINSSVRDYAVKEHFKDFSIEDLQDQNLVTDALKGFVSDNAGIIMTSKKSGAGTTNGSSVQRDSGTISRSDIKPGQMSREQIDAAWAKAGAGEIE